MITVVGIGPGRSDLLTLQALKVIQNADVIFGSSRQMKNLLSSGQKGIDYKGNLENLISQIGDFGNLSIVVLASGDPLLYGVGSVLRRHFDDVKIISGISSLHYIFSKIDQDMNDVYLTSAHGRIPDFTLWFRMHKVAAVTDRVYTPAVIAKQYVKAGMDATFYIGSQLSYEDECVVKAKASEIQNMSFQGLCVVVIINEG